MKNNQLPSKRTSKVNEFGFQNQIYNLFDKPISIKKASVESGIPEHFIHQVLHKLIKAGKIKSYKVMYCYESMSKVMFYVKTNPYSFTIKPLKQVMYGSSC